MYYVVSIPGYIIHVNEFGVDEGRQFTDSIVSLSKDTLTVTNTQALAFRRGKKVIIIDAAQSKSKMKLIEQHLDYYKLKGVYNNSEFQVISTFDQKNRNDAFWNFERLYPSEFYLPTNNSNNPVSFTINSKENEIQIEPLNSKNGVFVYDADSIKDYRFYTAFNYYTLKDLNEIVINPRNNVNDSVGLYTLFATNDGQIYTTGDLDFNKTKNNENRNLNNSLIGTWELEYFDSSNNEVSKFINDSFSLKIDSTLSLTDLRWETPHCFVFDPYEPQWCLFGQLKISPSGEFLVLENSNETTIIPFELVNDKITLEVFPLSHRTTISLTRKRP